MSDEAIIYVSPRGDDGNTGRTADNSAGDGPLRTIKAAQRVARSIRRKTNEPKTIRIVLREGTYSLDGTLHLAEADFGAPEKFDWHTTVEPVHPVVYESYPRERAVLSGGRRIDGFRETTVNGVNAWVAEVPGVRSGGWSFSQIWVNGERRFRPILPKSGEYLIETLYDAEWEGAWSQTVGKGTDRFGYAMGDIDPKWRNLKDVEIVILSLWRSMRARVDRVDPAERIVYIDRNSGMRLSYDFGRTGAAYNVENVFEALDSPGEWYLDRTDGLLYYVPMPGETIGAVEVVAPYLETLIEIRGGRLERGVESKQLNTHPILTLRNLVFSHVEWQTPQDVAAIRQSAPIVPGAVSMKQAHYVSIEGCTVEHVGTYAIALEDDCTDVRIVGCTLRDLGAGGIKIWHGCGRNVVSDCDIGDGGHLFPPAAGVLIGDAPSNIVLHNDIHDFYYTGVSIGWNWGYEENRAGGNVVEWNHIHHLGKGKLSDMGGIYTLGMQPGTRLRYNLIHDIRSRTYGGWAIYPDEGSSRLLIEYNCCYDTKCAPFHQHFGLENIVRNNIFAFGVEAQIERGRAESHRSFLFEQNIVIYSEGALLKAGARGKPWTPETALFLRNCYFHTSGGSVEFDGMSFEEWQRSGQDAGSIVADPKCRDLSGRDFTIAGDSPAIALGFVPFDLSNAGPRVPTGSKKEVL